MTDLQKGALIGAICASKDLDELLNQSTAALASALGVPEVDILEALDAWKDIINLPPPFRGQFLGVIGNICAWRHAQA
jgi:hypothetical protein